MKNCLLIEQQRILLRQRCMGLLVGVALLFVSVCGSAATLSVKVQHDGKDMYWNVLLDGRNVGQTPLSLEVPGGTHRIMLKKNIFSFIETVRVGQGEVYDLVKTVPAYGALRVVCEYPRSKIWIGEKIVGTGRLFLPEVHPGEYEVKCKTPSSFGSAKAKVTSGKQALAKIGMKRYGRIEIACLPKTGTISLNDSMQAGNPTIVDGLSPGKYKIDCHGPGRGYDAHRVEVPLEYYQTKKVNIDLHRNMKEYNAWQSAGIFIGVHGSWMPVSTSGLDETQLDGNTVLIDEGGYYHPNTSNLFTTTVEVGATVSPYYFFSEWAIGFIYSPYFMGGYFNLPVLAGGWYTGRRGYQIGVIDRMYFYSLTEVPDGSGVGIRFVYGSFNYHLTRDLRLDAGISLTGFITEEIEGATPAWSDDEGGGIVASVMFEVGISYYPWLFGWKGMFK